MRLVLASLPQSVVAVAPVFAADDPTAPVPSLRETVSVGTTADSMDDPAVWVHPTDPSRSLIIGTWTLLTPAGPSA